MAKLNESILLNDGNLIPHPDKITTWCDNTKLWPSITYGDIYNHLIETKAVDGKAMKCFKSLDSFNYFLSGWVISGTLQLLFYIDYIFL